MEEVFPRLGSMKTEKEKCDLALMWLKLGFVGEDFSRGNERGLEAENENEL